VFVRFGILVTEYNRDMVAKLHCRRRILTSLGTKVIQSGTYLFLCISCYRALSDTVVNIQYSFTLFHSTVFHLLAS